MLVSPIPSRRAKRVLFGRPPPYPAAAFDEGGMFMNTSFDLIIESKKRKREEDSVKDLVEVSALA